MIIKLKNDLGEFLTTDPIGGIERTCLISSILM